MTKTLLKGLFALAALLVVLQGAARAADETKSHPYVVIVGIDKYQDDQILPRKHAEADAKMLYDVLTDSKYLGADADHVRLLLGSPEKGKSELATKENILKALHWVTEKAGKDDLVVFAYLGQGAPVKERTCYFTVDSTFKDRAKDALAAGEIEGALEKLKSQRFCAFIDVNFKGFKAGKEPVSDPDPAKMYQELLGKDDEVAAPPSRLVFLANGGSKPSLDLAKHGVFAKVIADGLKGKADNVGYEPDGVITADELVKYVRKEMPELARANGKTDEEKAQQPLVLEGHTNDFVIGRNPEAATKAQERLEKFEKIAKDNNLRKEIVEEGSNYLRRMPKLKAQQNIRKAYQKLADGDLTAKAFVEERDRILAGTRMTAEDATDYANKVMEGVLITVHYYFKTLNSQQLVDAAVRGMYKKLEEPIPSAIKEKLDNIKNIDKAGLVALLRDARRHLGLREDLASGKDITLSLNGMMGKLDRHSGYVDPETVDKMRTDIKGSFSGIGVQIRVNRSKDQLQVVTPIKGSPAYQAKLYAGDIITHIVREVDNQGNPLPQTEVIPTKGMTTEEAVKKIVGKAGTKVKLIIEREGEAKPLEFELIRGTIQVESVVGFKRDAKDNWDYVIDPDNHICYVRLTQFQETTAHDLKKLMQELSTNGGIKGFILDLRFNPGGLLDSAVKICNLFINEGTVVTIKPRIGQEQTYVGTKNGYKSFPMVCLVNGYSASASEIVSACLQDHNRAVVVGSRSYGKGSVQTIIPFEETGGLLKITTATFWRPNNRNLNKASTSGKDEEDWGVKPNDGYDLPLSVKELNDLQDHQRDSEIIHRPDKKREATNGFTDRQLDMALEYLRRQIKLANKSPETKKAG